MNFQKQGRIFQLSSILNLPIELDEAWEFLSNPANLKIITPDYMGFNILSGTSEPMYPGQIISYNVSPLMGLKMNWVTEISHVKEKEFFVDEQRVGPYALWHHKHFVREIENGTEMRDVVHYQLPLPLIANRFHSILVKPKLRDIFNYRTKTLTDMFGEYKEK